MEASEPDVHGSVDYLVVEFPADTASVSGEIEDRRDDRGILG